MKPKIRLRGFCEEWVNSPFPDTFDHLKNNSLSRAELSNSGDVMNIHYGDILIKYGECVDTHSDVETYVSNTEVGKKLYKSCPIKNGDIVFADAAEDNTVGKCSEIVADDTDKIVSGLHTIPVRPKEAFAPKYFGYYLNSSAYHNQLIPHIQGTKISSISKKAMAHTYVSFPSCIDEQQAIATFFQNLDSIIKSITKKIASLKQMKAACLQSMFPQEGETTPRVRFIGFNETWERLPIKSITSFSKGHGYSKSDIRKKGCPIILYGRMYTKYEVNISSIDTYVIPKPNSIYSSGNEVIMPASGETPEDIACASAVKTKGVILGGDINIMRFDLDRINTSFIALSLSSGAAKKALSSMAQGKSVVHLRNSDIEKISLLIPSIKEQEAIASYFESLDSQIVLHSQQLQTLKKIKYSCMNNMFI